MFVFLFYFSSGLVGQNCEGIAIEQNSVAIESLGPSTAIFHTCTLFKLTFSVCSAELTPVDGVVLQIEVSPNFAPTELNGFEFVGVNQDNFHIYERIASINPLVCEEYYMIGTTNAVFNRPFSFSAAINWKDGCQSDGGIATQIIEGQPIINNDFTLSDIEWFDPIFPPADDRVWSAALSEQRVSTWRLSGILTIDKDYTISEGSRLAIDVGSAIIVNPGVTLTILGTSISGCQELWSRIEIRPTGRLIISNSIIEDGQTAIFANDITSTSLTNNTFRNNDISYFGNGGAVGLIHVGDFSGNTFLSPSLSGGGIGETAIRIENIRNNISFSGEGNDMSLMGNGVIALNSNFTIDGSRIHDLLETGDFPRIGVIGRSERNPLDMTVENCEIFNCRKGIESDRMLATVSSNTIELIEEDGIHSHNHGQLTANNNQKISATQHAIFLDENRNALINNNELIEATGTGNEVFGIRANKSFATRVTNNLSVTAVGAKATVHSNDCFYLQAVDNNITNFFDNGSGIQNLSTLRINLNCNDIVGAGGNSSGIWNNDSPGTIECNKTTAASNGIQFEGQGNIILKGNKMVGNSGTGLWIGGDAAISTQRHNGNTWVSTSATHNGDEFQVSFSKFFVHTNNPATFWYPSLLIHNANDDEDWFDTSEDDMEPFECPNSDCGGTGIDIPEPEYPEPPEVECEDFTDLDVGIAQGVFYQEGSRAGTNYNGTRQLIRKIKIPCPENPVMPDDVASFALAYEDSDISKLVDIELVVNLINDWTNNLYLEVLQGQENLDLSVENLGSVTQQLFEEGLTESEITALQNQQNQLMDDVVTLQQELDAKWANYNNWRNQQAAQLQIENNSIITTSLPAFYEQQVNNVYLQTTAIGNYSFSAEQETTLVSIAELCPQDGGLAVYKARGVLASVDPDLVFEDSDCNLDNNQYRITNPTKTNRAIFTIAPNPANEFVDITFDKSMDYEAEIRLVNLLGQVAHKTIRSKNVALKTIDVSKFGSGIYIIQIWNKDELMETQKLSIIR